MVNHHSNAATMTLGAILAGSFLLSFMLWVAQRIDDGSRDTSAKHEQALTSGQLEPQLQSTPRQKRFPWEPTPVNNSIVSHGDGQSFNGRSNGFPVLSKEQQKKRLDVIASMTFANGGLRIPSCPCCE